MSENNQRKTISVEAVGRYLGIGRNKAYKTVQSEGFPSFKIGNRIIIPADSFESWIDSQCKKAAQ